MSRRRISLRSSWLVAFGGGLWRRLWFCGSLDCPECGGVLTRKVFAQRCYVRNGGSGGGSL